jgi:hypothetical protein
MNDRAVDGDRAAGALPNLVVIGAQKCGTSTLHYYLGLHPEIAMSDTKELNFFIEERNWPRGLEWYRAQFDPDAPVRGETSPNYTADPIFAGVPDRMHAVVPDARLIFLVRDPLERIAAHWVHNVAKGRAEGDLAQTLRARSTYVARSRYHQQLQGFLALYPRDRILVLEQEDLRSHRGATLREAFEFVRVDPEFTHPRFREERHKTGRKKAPTRLGARLTERRARAGRTIVPARAWEAASGHWPLGRPIERPQVIDALDDEALAVLRDDAAKLRELTGRSFERWSI